MAESKNETPKEMPPMRRTGRPPLRRRQWIVDPKMQSQYVLCFSLIGGVVGMAIAALTLQYIGRADRSFENLLVEPSSRFTIAGLFVFMICVVPIAGIFLSHRIAGPAYRLRKAAIRIAHGEYNFRIRLRKHDHFQNVADAFNTMLASLERNRQATAQEKTEMLDAVVGILDDLTATEVENLPEALRALEELESRLVDSSSIASGDKQGVAKV
jgi:methyl-accepting chemotaxis protein